MLARPAGFTHWAAVAGRARRRPVPALVRHAVTASLLAWLALHVDLASWLRSRSPVRVDMASGRSLLIVLLPIAISAGVAWLWRLAVLVPRHARLEVTHRDPLTGLANRAQLIERLHAALVRSRLGSGRVAVLFCDLDRFKPVNDTFGHEMGDRLLVQVAERLQEVVRGGDLLARLGGDEFVMVCEDLAGTQEAEVIAARIQLSFAVPFQLGPGAEVAAGTSIGIAVADGQATPATLMREADAAMYRAKAEGRGRSATFDRSMRVALARRTEMERGLRRAFERGDLSLHYQPVVSLRDEEIVGVEALLRWHDPQRGWVSPAEFVPLLEDTGLIVPVGSWVLDEACRQARRWCDAYPDAPLTVAVNVSTRQLAQPNFADVVTGVLTTTDLPPGLLCLEITEATLMDDVVLAWHGLRQVKALGVALAIDDFGTGYSSLSFVKNFALDALKIDQSFVRGLTEAPEDTAIAAAVTSMARALGLATVAEGVETPAQLALLRTLGCDFAQGYYFTRPQPAAVIDEFLAARHARRSAGDPDARRGPWFGVTRSGRR